MVNIGLIGCGYISRKHLETIATFDALQLVAVSDIQVSRMEEAIQFYNERKAKRGTISQYENYKDLLLDPKIDVVIISVISGLHAEVAKQAISHGKHVIVEKPLALSLNDADELIRIGRANEKIILVCHQLRYHPLLSKIKTLIDDGALGELYLGSAILRINRNAAYYDAAGWRGTWSLDGGMLLNQGIHLIDLLTWYFGDVTRIYGDISTRNIRKETEDIATGIIHFANNAKGVIEANTVTKPSNLGYYLSIFGEKGTISIGGKQLTTVQHCHIEDHPDLEAELRNLSSSKEEHHLMYENYFSALLKEDELLMSAEAGKNALQTIFGIYKSHLEGRPVSFPLANFATSEMERKENNS